MPLHVRVSLMRTFRTGLRESARKAQKLGCAAGLTSATLFIQGELLEFSYLLGLPFLPAARFRRM